MNRESKPAHIGQGTSVLANERRLSALFMQFGLNWLPLLALPWAFRVLQMSPLSVQVLLVTLAVVFVGIQQHAINLCVHEAVHWLFFKDKATNDRVANWVFAYPLLMSVETARFIHLQHHKYLWTHKDPKVIIFEDIRRWKFVRFVLFSGLGGRFIKQGLGFIQSSRTASEKYDGAFPIVKVLAAQLALLAYFTWAGGSLWSFIILWALPYVTTAQLIKGLRSILEHQIITGEVDEVAPFTRSFRLTWLDRFLFMRVGFDHHWAHHRYPSVPFFNLHKIDEPPGKYTCFEALVRLIRAPAQTTT